MTRIRQNVWELGNDWADPVLWYARGAKAMMARRLAEPTSWRFYAAIHGLDPALWRRLGHLAASDTVPSATLRRKFWRQCQHGSWYFLPWHRGYLLAFEATVRKAVVDLGGPADWSLPYWNYAKAGQAQLPRAFASPDWPDGNGDNPLFTPQRHGPRNDGTVVVPTGLVNLDALRTRFFSGVGSGGNPGFGGVDTGFSHGGPVHGGIESQPHDIVHGLVGGFDRRQGLPGLMSDPDTAGLDPIFWLHHANIDRLWQVWRENPATDVDPTDAAWLAGPTGNGERAFALPMPDGSTWTYTPRAMADLAALDYTYDDLTAPGPARRVEQPQRPGARPQTVVPEGTGIVSSGENVELVGASRQSLPVSGAEARATVHLDGGMRRKVADSRARAAEPPRVEPPAVGPSGVGPSAVEPPAVEPPAVEPPAVEPGPGEPDRVFLNLENVRGAVDGAALQVYLGLPEGADPADHPQRLAGSVALFGVRKATRADGEQSGQGLTFVLDVTAVVDDLRLSGALDVDALEVRIVPVSPVPEGAEVHIGRISVFRQGR